MLSISASEINRSVFITPLESTEIRDKPIKKIQEVLDIILNTFKGKDLHIIGSSACSILDHLLQNKALVFRDLDLAVVMGKCTTNEETLAIAEELKSKIPEVEKIDSLEDRPRTPRGVPLEGNSLFSAGKGFFLQRNCDLLKLLDITLFDHAEDLEVLNGVFRQDNISIVLNEKRTFAQFITEARSKSIEKLIEDGWLRQPENAYQDWREGKLEIRNWEDISRRPNVLALRIVRSLNKKGLLEYLITPSQDRSDLQKQWKDLNQAITSNSFMDYHFQARLFERCLKDKGCALELKALCNLGVFDKWLPYLKNVISWLSVDEIDQKLSIGSQTTPEGKLLGLLQKCSLTQQLHTLFFAFGGPNRIVDSSLIVWKGLELAFPEFGAVDMQACTKLIKKRCEQDQTKYAKCVARILSSVSLHENEKCQLLLRLLVSDDKELASLFPDGNAMHLKNYWEKIAKPRVGFFTGVFDPITNTHVQIVAHAIDQMHLEQVIVAPVYLSKKINRPTIDWKNRREMVEIGLKEIPEAKVVDEELCSALAVNIETAFTILKERMQAVWVHISGTDAFERFKQLNFLDSYLKQNIRLFVVHRVGLLATKPPPKYDQLISYFQPEIPLGIYGTFSARDVRQMIASGQEISGVVPEGVGEYIKAHKFYYPLPPMEMPWQIAAPDSFTKIIKQQLPFANVRSDVIGSSDSNEVLKKLLEGGKTALILKIADMPEGKQRLTLIYQQSLNDLPKIMDIECFSNQTMPTCSNLLQKLIHDLIGHSDKLIS